MLLTAIVGAIYVNLSKPVLRQIPASTMTPIAMLAGCLCLFPFTLTSGIGEHLMALSSMQLCLMIYLGVIAGGVAFFLFNWSLTRSTATFNTLFVTINPITAIILGNIFLGEIIEINFIVGIIILFTGLGLAVTSERNESAVKI